jgi:phosphoesterase RecJ-like protein
MVDLLFKKIKEYNTIIIHRHTRPDLDALGSQLGLAKVLKHNYPEKNIYVVGDGSSKYDFIGNMDIIDDSVYSEALAIIVDVAVEALVSDSRYKLAKEVFVIDHHKNPCDITENFINESSRVAVGELIANLIFNEGLEMPKDAATAFYGAIITDGGRFMFGSNLAETLRVSSLLVSCGADYDYIYKNIYVEKLADKQMKAWFANQFKVTDNGVAYLKNPKEVFDRFPTDFMNISRGMLSVMSGVEEIIIWLNFTYDASRDVIVGEFRSREIPIVDIAYQFGGGGHNLACGASFKTWEEVDECINAFDNLAKENR